MRSLLVAVVSAFVGWFGAGLFRTEALTATPSAEREPAGSILGARQGVVALPSTMNDLLDFRPSVEALLTIDQASVEKIESWLRQVAREKPFRSGLVHLLYARLVELDYKRAIKLSAEVPELQGNLSQAIRVMAGEDLLGAFALALEKGSKWNYANAVFSGVTAEGALLLYDQLLERGYDKTKPHLISNLMRLLYDAGAEQAAQKAMAHALAVEDGADSLESVLNRWCSDDPKAAFAWANRLE